jgi:hypothetical protein
MGYLFRVGGGLILLACAGACATPNKYEPDALDTPSDALIDRPVDQASTVESGGNVDSIASSPADAVDGGAGPDTVIPAMLGIADFCSIYARERVFWQDRCGIPRDPDRQIAEMAGRFLVCPDTVELAVT